jgi:hypothetical protein
MWYGGGRGGWSKIPAYKVNWMTTMNAQLLIDVTSQTAGGFTPLAGRAMDEVETD